MRDPRSWLIAISLLARLPATLVRLSANHGSSLPSTVRIEL
jgi:hypothetical protein